MASTVIPRMLTSGELLWENNSPTSPMDPRVIPISKLANYKFVLIIFRMKASSASYKCSNMTCVDGGSYVAVCPNWDTNINIIRGRSYIVTTTGIDFKNGYKLETYGVATADSDSMVPVAIYGLN